MARIFNIYVLFEEAMYSAMVSVRTTPFFTEYTLIHFNEDLLRLLPGNKILSRGSEHYVFPDACSENSIPLMNAITKAIAEHMHSVDI